MLNFLFNPNGRVSRSQMWLGFLLPQFVLYIGAGAVDAALFGAEVTKAAGPTAPRLGFVALLSLLYFWPCIAIAVKRFHDRGMSGWWVLWFWLAVVAGLIIVAAGGVELADPAAAPPASIGAVALIGLLLVCAATLVQLVMFYVLGGDEGENRFGPDPRRGGSVAAASTWADDLDPLEAVRRVRAGASAPQAATGGPSPKPRGPSAPPPAPLRKRPTPRAPYGTPTPARSSFGRRGLV